ncbi:MAG: TetR/AcrR family transcriptional regulator [Myxococcota bacterium]
MNLSPWLDWPPATCGGPREPDDGGSALGGVAVVMPYPQRIDADHLGANALAFVEERGWERWSLRELAASLGVSANALYRYVADREDLSLAIAEAAARALLAEMRGARGEGLDRLIDMAMRYVTFSTQRPHAFSAFIQAKPPLDHPRVAVWRTLWHEVRDTVAEVVPDAIDAAGFAVWGLVHGRAELARGPARHAAPTEGLAQAIRALVEGFQGMGVVPSPLPPGIRLEPE